MTDLLGGIPMIFDPEIRNKAYDLVKPLAAPDLPPQFASMKGAAGAQGRFVRIELPRRGTLTLAEVQVFSDGVNIATSGKATQSSTSNGGDASRAIDGNTNGLFGAGSQTHTVENEKPAPGGSWISAAIAPSNPSSSGTRTESSGIYVKRLDNFHTHHPRFESSRDFQEGKKTPPPPNPFRIPIGGGDSQTSIPPRRDQRAGQHAGKSTGDIRRPRQSRREKTSWSPAASRGIRNLPRKAWTKDQAGPLLPRPRLLG